MTESIIEDNSAQLSSETIPKGKSWSHQKELQKAEIPGIIAVKEKMFGVADERTKGLIILAYLTAGRISEVLGISKNGLSLIVKKVREKDRPVLLISMPNEKNKKRKWKEIPIPLDNPTEKEMADELMAYANGTTDYLFPSARGGHINRKTAWQLIQDSTGWNPHWMRHLRITHLVTLYDFPDHLLVRFAGWTDSRPAKNYTELRWTDILERM